MLDGGSQDQGKQFDADLAALMPLLKNYLIRWQRDVEIAEDITSRVMVRALERRHQFTPGTNFKAWVFSILRTQVFDQSRRRKVCPDGLDGEFQISQITIDDDPAAGINHRQIMAMISDLREPLRAVAHSILVDGCRYDETAAKLGMDMGYVKSALHRARQHLQAQLR